VQIDTRAKEEELRVFGERVDSNSRKQCQEFEKSMDGIALMTEIRADSVTATL